MIYTVQLRFNSRLSGTGQIWNGEIDAGSVVHAIDLVSAKVVRDPNHGHAIFVTGATVEQTRGSSK